MGMPITVEILDPGVTDSAIEMVFDYFAAIDRRFSPYRSDSELSQLNRGEIDVETSSDDMRLILQLSEQTRRETGGY
ncbi:MAG TPA: FAD:protein FMN transferase, partial [Thermomicrobiaceae bacterium]|nr:FAD:protein FMN transferase [Thermomicrobiaceae bacterium]